MDNNEQFVHSTPTSFVPHAHVSGYNGIGADGGNSNNLNINLPDNNAVLRLEVELRDKNVRRRPHQRRAKGYHLDRSRAVAGMAASAAGAADGKYHAAANTNNYFVPMEKVSDFLVYITFSSLPFSDSFLASRRSASCHLFPRHAHFFIGQMKNKREEKRFC